MNLGRLIRRGVKEAVEQAERAGPTNAAVAANVGRAGHTTAVYSDGSVTIVHRDGHTEVFHHDGEESAEG